MRLSAVQAGMAALDISAVIFDCFGVLYVDSKVSLLATVPEAKRQELADIFTSNNYGFFGRKDYLQRVADAAGMTTDEVARYIASEHTLNQELVSLITEQVKPQYRTGLLSNIGREWIDDFFTKHQLHDLFDEVVLSGEEGMTKPHPEIFSLIASRLGVRAEDCLMIDDIEENCRGAELAGMRTIQYQTNSQLLDALYELKLLR